MEITPTQRSITEYTLTLSEADAREAVDSPWTIGERIAEQLRAAGVTPSANGSNGHKPKPESHIRVGRRPNARAGARKPKGKQAPASAADPKQGGYQKVSCPVSGCGRVLAQARLPLHLRTKHPDHQPEPTDTAATAA